MSDWISVDDVKFLLSFCPDEISVPKGLDPTFYFTLSQKGDQEIADKLKIIRDKLPRDSNK